MSENEYINLGTPVAGPYTPGVKSGGFLFISGQGAKHYFFFILILKFNISISYLIYNFKLPKRKP
ncbi:MAG: hypothetical protein ACFFA8_00105 [Promethearchaeota archaeon]